MKSLAKMLLGLSLLNLAGTGGGRVRQDTGKAGQTAYVKYTPPPVESKRKQRKRKGKKKK